MTPSTRSGAAPAPRAHRLATIRNGSRWLAIGSLALLVACSDGDDGDSASTQTDPLDDNDTVNDGSDTGSDSPPTEPGPAPEPDTLAFVSSAAPDFSAGQIERFTLGESVVSTGTTAATGSDIRVESDGQDIYEIGRFQLDSLTRYTPDGLDTPLWQYSVNGAETAVNPHAVVFASATKAYVLRYGSPFVWIVDPSATTEANFMTGTIDLSAYDDDNVPNATDAVLVDGRLFVLMQRLDGFTPSRDGYVAVIDTETDTEIDTGMGEDGLFGIPLASSNPGSISYLAESDEIHVLGRGNLFGNESVPGDPYDGGIEVIDPDTFERDMLIDDGTAEDNAGFFADVLVLSPSRGYLLTYATFGVTTLRAFNPTTGLIEDGVVAGLADRDISVLAEDPQGRVWVGLNSPDAPGFTVLDPSDDSVVIERVAVEFNPNGIVFVPAPGDDEES